jgi:hypothetical protein
MRKTRFTKRVPFFPLIPLVPFALLVGSFVTSLRALSRVREVERRMPVDVV